ncbi:MAG: uracil-DNA glycosylase, partial [Janthinobacterium lividum]
MWTEQVSPDWADALRPAAPALAQAEAFCDAEEAAGRASLPERSRVLRAFSRPLADVRVLVVGQDPYPTAGHPVGLAFSVAPDVRPIPRSLRNLYVELESDLGVPPAEHGDLTAWFEQGVLLLNRVLTVEPGRSGSHRRHGWEQVTQRAIEALVERGGPLVAVLWGADARKLAPLLGDVPVVES